MNVRTMSVAVILLALLAACGSESGNKKPANLPQVSQNCETGLAGGSYKFTKLDGGHWLVSDSNGFECRTALLLEVQTPKGTTVPLQTEGQYLVIRQLMPEGSNLLYGYEIRPAN